MKVILRKELKEYTCHHEIGGTSLLEYMYEVFLCQWNDFNKGTCRSDMVHKEFSFPM